MMGTVNDWLQLTANVILILLLLVSGTYFLSLVVRAQRKAKKTQERVSVDEREQIRFETWEKCLEWVTRRASVTSPENTIASISSDNHFNPFIEGQRVERVVENGTLNKKEA